MRKFPKAESRILAGKRQAAGYEFSSKGYILQQSTFPALKQLAIPHESAQGSRSLLQRN